jgi:hypothetical protein
VCRVLSLVSSLSIVPWFTVLSCHVLCCAVLDCVALCCVVLCCPVVCSMLTVDFSCPQTFCFIALSSAR